MANQEDIFFIYYEGRSGSTYLANQLMMHSNISIIPETNFMLNVINGYERLSIQTIDDLKAVILLAFSDRKIIDLNINEDEIMQEGKDELPMCLGDFFLLIMTRYQRKNGSGTNMLGVKKGNYYKYHKVLEEIFPGARYICLIRDGRAVFSSQKSSIRSVTQKPFNENPYTSAFQWKQQIHALRKIKQEHNNETLFVSYEELILHKTDTIKAICSFLKLPYIDVIKCNNQYVVPARYGDLHKNIHKPAMKDRVTAWQEILPYNEIYAYESVAAEELENEGYVLTCSSTELNCQLLKVKMVVLYRLKSFFRKLMAKKPPKI